MNTDHRRAAFWSFLGFCLWLALMSGMIGYGISILIVWRGEGKAVWP